MRKIYSIPLLIITLLLIASIIIGTSYSLWIKTNNQKDENVVTTSCFSSTFTEESTINLKNAMPISDTSGLKKTPYTFTLKNNCDVNLKINISLDVLNTSTMTSNSIKVALKSSDIFMTNATLLTNLSKKTTPDIKNAKEAYTLGEDFLGKNATKTYSIWAWMDENVGNEEQGKIFNSKIVVTNTAINAKLLTDKITDLSIANTTNFATNDPDNNIRYIGADPSNYVYFNCSDYNNQSDSTCEKWRIIGVFKNVTKSDGTKEDLVKIVKDDRLGNVGFSWDYKKNGVGTSANDNGSNDWTDSQLMMMLNPTDYLKSGYTIDNNIVKDSKGQAIYQNMGSYYNGTSGCKPAAIASGADFTCTSIDFTSTGLKNDLTRNAIESVVWNFGGSSTYNDVTASMFYSRERGTTVYSGYATTWTGKIGLMYPSDYGYATAGGATTNRAACLAKELYNWDGSGVSDCKNNDYLYKSSYYQWTLVPDSSGVPGVLIVVTGGDAVNSYAYHDNCSVRPTAFLKSNISITDVGDGSSNNPYRLILS